MLKILILSLTKKVSLGCAMCLLSKHEKYTSSIFKDKSVRILVINNASFRSEVNYFQFIQHTVCIDVYVRILSNVPFWATKEGKKTDVEGLFSQGTATRPETIKDNARPARLKSTGFIMQMTIIIPVDRKQLNSHHSDSRVRDEERMERITQESAPKIALMYAWLYFWLTGH